MFMGQAIYHAVHLKTFETAQNLCADSGLSVNSSLPQTHQKPKIYPRLETPLATLVLGNKVNKEPTIVECQVR